MKKSIIINEADLEKIITEELGIAKRVIELTNKIRHKVYELVRNNETSSVFSIDELNVIYKLYTFDCKSDYIEWILCHRNDYKNGYSYSENTLYITCIVIKDTHEWFGDLDNTIQHEVEHYWQCKNKKGNLSTSKYQNIVNLMNHPNYALATISTLLYFSNHFEIDAYINGAYSEAINGHIKCEDYKEFIEKTQLSELFSVLNDVKQFLMKFDYNSPYTVNAINILKENGLLNFSLDDDIKSRLLKIFDKTIQYAYRKIGMAFSLYKINGGGKDDLIIKNIK